MRKLLLVLSLVISNYGISQSYSYRFEGTLTEQTVSQITSELQTKIGVEQVKFLRKEHSGELCFVLPNVILTSEESNPNTLKTIKDLLIANNLVPGELKEREY